jgi:hypothetical protein
MATPSSNPSGLREPTVRWTKLPTGLRLFATLAVILQLAAFAALPYYWVKYGEMWRTELWTRSTDIFGDFWHYRALFQLIHTQAFFTSADRFAYPAPCAVILDLLYHLPYPHGVFVELFSLIFLSSAFLFYRLLVRLGLAARVAAAFVIVLVLCSYPWDKLLDRSNVELFVYLFVASGLWAFVTGRRELAAVLWGCAGAMKIYPLVMLAVFFRKSMLRPLLIGFATFAGVLLISFWFVGPTIPQAAMGSVHGVTGFLGSYAGSSRVWELTIDHSLLGGIKELCLLDVAHRDHHWTHQSTGYQAAVIILGPMLYWFRIRKLPVWNQTCLFIVAIVLLSPVSYDYTLIHIYLVLGIVVAAYLYALGEGTTLPRARAFFITFAIITTSQGWMQHSVYRFNGLIKCIALLVLSWLLLSVPLTLGSRADETVTT